MRGWSVARADASRRARRPRLSRQRRLRGRAGALARVPGAGAARAPRSPDRRATADRGLRAPPAVVPRRSLRALRPVRPAVVPADLQPQRAAEPRSLLRRARGLKKTA